MRIAIFGDILGHWCDFRDAVADLHSQSHLDLVLQCGDAQPIRNQDDLEYMHCPKKYRKLGDFSVFYNGTKKFSVPVLFIGGNHEPWNFLDENREGGLLAFNIEFMGRVGMREIMGIRIAGISGVFSPKHFYAQHPKRPYPISMRKQASYGNSDDIDKVLEFANADILLLHEWPSLMNGARNQEWPSHWGKVGSENLTEVVELLSPKYVFCGHMHTPAFFRNGRTKIV
jgi:Icc-related predicted phosphoesterase